MADKLFSMKHRSLFAFGLIACSAVGQTVARPFQKLHIPEAISGTTFNLDLHPASKVFWKGSKGTPTIGYNNEKFWGPTLFLKKGQTVTLNMKNGLKEPTTTHWHGLHIPAIMDGGPHQIVDAGTTWSPTFEVKNNAGTYWYHPHAHETTQNQLTSGAGGLIIIQDETESKLNLPRTYGVDDIPLTLTSRRFTLDDQFTFNGDNDKYGDYQLVNGVMDPETTLPAQWVRLRILNAEVERGYELGFSDNRTYYLIATDGGLVDQPVALKRLQLHVGERVEILVNLGGDSVGENLDLMAYNAGHPFGFPGGEPGTSPPNGGYLNNIDYRILRINVGKKTAGAITDIPKTLTRNVFPSVSDVSKERSIRITADNPGEPFGFDEKLFKMDRIDQIIKLDSTEKWTVTNNRIFGHSFHIHDVQFKIVSRSNGPVQEYEKGWKDSMYVPRGESVTFVTKFDDFASDQHPFMYHCHMSNHEDGGLMGQFLVVKDPGSVSTTFRQRMDHPLTNALLELAKQTAGSPAPSFSEADLSGRLINMESLVASKPLALFFVDEQCPCARDATPFMNRLQEQFGDAFQLVGVINCKTEPAKVWARTVGAEFPIIADADSRLIDRYRVKNAGTVTLVTQGGKIAITYPGYGREMLLDLSTRIAALTQAKVVRKNFADAPKKLIVGCPLDSRRP